MQTGGVQAWLIQPQVHGLIQPVITTRTQTHTHTHTHANKHTNTHTHTHANTQRQSTLLGVLGVLNFTWAFPTDPEVFLQGAQDE